MVFIPLYPGFLRDQGIGECRGDSLLLHQLSPYNIPQLKTVVDKNDLKNYNTTVV